MEQKIDNIFITGFNTVHDTPAFSKIKVDDYMPAFMQSLSMARAEIDNIINNPDHASFSNTIEALEFSGKELDKVSSVFFNLNHAETNEQMQNVAKEISPILSEFSNDVSMNSKLFARVKHVFDNKQILSLTNEQSTLLDNTYKGFVRSGALLSDEDKMILRTISKDLSQLTLEFGDNVLADTNDFVLHITDKDDLSGLPEGIIEAAKSEAVDRELKGWAFTMQFPSYVPFMMYADSRPLRKSMFMSYSSRCVSGDNNNKEIILKIASLRQKRAELFNYKNHASFALENRMAKNPETVSSFLAELLDASLPKAKQEFKQLQDFAKEQGADFSLQRWDWSYYAEKLKTKLFDVNDEITRPYFELERVTKGIFELAGDLYGIKFVENKEIDKYHQDVVVYEVFDAEDKFMSVFYTDFHPRQSKQGGAWMTSFREQSVVNNIDNRPHVSIVCNFTKPTPTKPSLLSFMELTTFLHEFGHALHGMLTKCTYPSLSGTSVLRDFVELPSQFMENYAYEKLWLDKVAKHYLTGETIPMQMVDKIIASGNFHEAYSFVRQLSFGILDMAWHTYNNKTEDVLSFEKNVLSVTQLFPDIDHVCASSAFSHIFAGGYAAGYYGYKWAEVLDADAFYAFKEKGIYDKDIALAFKANILEKGGSIDPQVLYKQFRGKDASIDALLTRSGLK